MLIPVRLCMNDYSVYAKSVPRVRIPLSPHSIFLKPASEGLLCQESPSFGQLKKDANRSCLFLHISLQLVRSGLSSIV